MTSSKEVGKVEKHGLVFFLTTFLILILSIIGFGQEKGTTPNGIIPRPPDTSALQVNLETTKSRYRPGSEIEIRYELNKKAYLYIYNIDVNGKVHLLFPNKYDQDNYLSAGKGKLPGKGYSFLAGEKQGGEYLQAIASKKPLKLFSSIDSERFKQDPFPQISSDPEAFAQSGEEEIKSDLDSGEWATSWTSIEVTNKLSKITVNSIPSRAEIYVDGELVGRTPGTFSVTPGEIELKLKLNNYETWRGKLNTVPYGKKTISKNLEPTRITWVKISSSPSAADVYVDGNFRGQTPVRLALNSGERGIVIEKKGYKTWKKEIDIDPQLNNDLKAKLSRVVSNKLSVTSNPSGAKIFIDGKYRGQTPRELTLNEEKVSLTIEKDGYQTWKRKVKTPGTVEATLSSINEDRKPKASDSGFVSLALNAGGFPENSFSFGTELTINSFVLGSSLRNTGSSELPEKINWVERPTGGGEETLNYGPEWEIYLGYELKAPFNLNLRFGPGVALQPQANLIPRDSDSSSSVRPTIVVARDAYFSLATNLTLHAGISTSRKGYSLDLLYHNRRGFVLGLGYNF